LSGKEAFMDRREIYEHNGKFGEKRLIERPKRRSEDNIIHV
jgi:hypothetical protein